MNGCDYDLPAPQVLHVDVDVPGLCDRVRLHPEPGRRGERQPHRAPLPQDAQGAQATEGNLPLAGHEGEGGLSTGISGFCDYPRTDRD